MKLYFKDPKHTGKTLLKSSFLLTQKKAEFNTCTRQTPLAAHFPLLPSVLFTSQSKCSQSCNYTELH